MTFIRLSRDSQVDKEHVPQPLRIHFSLQWYSILTLHGTNTIMLCISVESALYDG